MRIIIQQESTPPLVEIFCCYAREDLTLFRDLEKHLAALKREGLATLWADIYTPAGADWEQTIHHHLDTAQIVLLLISPDFLNSDACFHQMKRAMESEQRGEARVIPILLRSVDWGNAPFAKLQILPQNGRPVESEHGPKPDEALAEVTRGIRQIITALPARQERRALLSDSAAHTLQMRNPHTSFVASSESPMAQLVQRTSTLAGAMPDLVKTIPTTPGAATPSISRTSSSSTRPIKIIAGSTNRASWIVRPSIALASMRLSTARQRGTPRKRFLFLALLSFTVLAGSAWIGSALITPPWQKQTSSSIPGSGIPSQGAAISHRTSPTLSSTLAPPNHSPVVTSTPTPAPPHLPSRMAQKTAGAVPMARVL